MKYKKQLLAASIAASVMVASPAFGGFVVVQADAVSKAVETAKQVPPPSFGQYRIMERDDPTYQPPAAPALVPAPAAVYIAAPVQNAPTAWAAPVTPPTRVMYAEQPAPAAPASAHDDSRRDNAMGRMQAESVTLEAQIERLRSELAEVRAQMHTVKNSSPVIAMAAVAKINHKLDHLEQQMAETGVAVLSVRFGPSSSKFEPSEEQGRELISTAMAAGQVNVYGHTDSSGIPERNRIMSMARAISAMKYMTAHGVAKRKIAVGSRGSSDPIGDNSTEEGRAKNRRVEIEFHRQG